MGLDGRTIQGIEVRLKYILSLQGRQFIVHYRKSSLLLDQQCYQRS